MSTRSLANRASFGLCITMAAPEGRGTRPCVVNIFPYTTISRSGIILIGQTELPSAMRSQSVHGSHRVIPSSRHVAILITLTPDPPLINIPAIHFPPTMASMFGQSQSITRSSISVSRTGVVDVVVVPSSVRRNPSRNLSTSRSNCSSVIVICMRTKSEMSGSISRPEHTRIRGSPVRRSPYFP
jgi:hypothetical protein